MTRESASAPQLRDATAADVPALVALERASFSDPWSAESFREVLRSTTARLRVAVVDGAVQGYSVSWHVADEAELANLAVATAFRRQRIAAALLDDLLAFAQAHATLAIYLEVRASNEAAQALYRSRGFDVVGRRRAYYQHPTEDAVLMRRSLQ
ncbi:MAG: ribosomal protein S18-alanine N-acetyltransferase [Gemmatimonadaceae bacterium]|nr:ribosomal protein S18-alanine N-acetyltransferase [Gemmatimonadaceae bacterium]